MKPIKLFSSSGAAECFNCADHTVKPATSQSTPPLTCSRLKLSSIASFSPPLKMLIFISSSLVSSSHAIIIYSCCVASLLLLAGSRVLQRLRLYWMYLELVEHSERKAKL